MTSSFFYYCIENVGVAIPVLVTDTLFNTTQEIYMYPFIELHENGVTQCFICTLDRKLCIPIERTTDYSVKHLHYILRLKQ